MSPKKNLLAYRSTVILHCFEMCDITWLASSAGGLLLEHNHLIKNVVSDSPEDMACLRDEKFDVVVLDPPAFIKRRKDAKKGLEAYRRLNELAMKVLEKDGILVSASCSYHLQREDLQNLLLKTSRSMGNSLSILEQGYQGPDHPMHPAIPETAYLKAIFARILSS